MAVIIRFYQTFRAIYSRSSSSMSKPSISSKSASSKSTFSSAEINFKSESLRVEFSKNNSLPVNRD